MKKHGICLLPDACYLSELNVPGKTNQTNLGECAAIQRFLSTHPNENVRPDRLFSAQVRSGKNHDAHLQRGRRDAAVPAKSRAGRAAENLSPRVQAPLRMDPCGQDLARGILCVEQGSAEGKREVRKQRDLAEGIYAVVKTVNPYYFFEKACAKNTFVVRW